MMMYMNDVMYGCMGMYVYVFMYLGHVYVYIFVCVRGTCVYLCVSMYTGNSKT